MDAKQVEKKSRPVLVMEALGFNKRGDDVQVFPEGGVLNLSHVARVQGARKQYFDLVPNYVEGMKA